MGVSAVMGKRKFIFVGGKEEGSGGTGWRGGDKIRLGNAPGNEYGPGMMAGLKSRNLT